MFSFRWLSLDIKLKIVMLRVKKEMVGVLERLSEELSALTTICKIHKNTQINIS